MNLFNRILIVLSVLILMAVMTLVCILPKATLVTAGQFLVDWGNYLGRDDLFDPNLRLLVGIAIALVLDVILLLFIAWEVIPRRKRFVSVQMVSGGNATVSLSSVEDQLKYKLDVQPGVVNVSIKARAKGKNVKIAAKVAISREALVTQTAETLVNTIQTVVTDDMGLQMAGKPDVKLEIIDTPVAKSQAAPRRSRGQASPLKSVEAISTTQALPPPLPEQAAGDPKADAPASLPNEEL